MNTAQTHLSMSWSISRGRETYGYNICRLVDDSTAKRYRCMGGGYDMQGTVFADWLEDVYQSELLAIADQAHSKAYRDRDGKYYRTVNDDGLYGMTHDSEDSRIRIDGGCGLESVIRIANAIGLSVQRIANRRGHLVAFIVSE